MWSNELIDAFMKEWLLGMSLPVTGTKELPAR